MKATIPRPSNAEFIALWQRAKSPTELALKLGLTALQVSKRASKLRQRGWGLKRFPTLFMRSLRAAKTREVT